MKASDQHNLYPTENEAESVTGLTPLPSDPNVVGVRVGRRVKVRLRSADIEALGITVGIPWTDALARRVQVVIERTKIHRAALRLLGQRDYTRGEMGERLGRHQPDHALVNSVLDELESGHWLDDEMFARRFVEELCRDEPASEMFLLQKLHRRRIDEALAGRVVSELLKDVDPIDSAESLARRRMKSMKNQPPGMCARKLAGHLARRGYEAEIVEDVMQRLKLVGDASESIEYEED